MGVSVLRIPVPSRMCVCVCVWRATGRHSGKGIFVASCWLSVGLGFKSLHFGHVFVVANDISQN